MLVALLLLLVFTLRTTVVTIFSSMVFINNPGVMPNNTRMVITRLLFFMAVGLSHILTVLNMSMVTMARICRSRYKSNRQEGNKEFHFECLRAEYFPPLDRRSNSVIRFQ